MYKIVMELLEEGEMRESKLLFESENRLEAVCRVLPLFKDQIKEWEYQYESVSTGVKMNSKDYYFFAVPANHDKCMRVRLTPAKKV